MNGAVATQVYRAASSLFESAAAPAFLRWRQRHGKEDPARLPERLGHPGMARPPGSLVWLHGASVGEGLALLPLIERLRERGDGVLLTTGTVTSSRVVGARLPPGALHRFVPIDTPGAVRRFFDHWRPDLAIFAESELWPNLLGEAKRRGVPAVLVNARMSARSFARWQRMPGLAGALLGPLDLILAQTEADAERFSTLVGRAVASVGNLKFDAVPPPADADALASLRQSVARRPVWVAASTHAGEDEICCDAHQRLQTALPGLLTIIVPRRVERGPELLAYAAARGLGAGLRSRGDAIAADTDIHIADTMGEIGLFYRLGTAVFVGKSLVDGGGGQNPIEPAKLGNAILHGPHTANFSDVYAAFDAAGAAEVVGDLTQLAAAVHRLLAIPRLLSDQARRAHEAAEHLAGATASTLRRLEPLLPCTVS